MKKLLCIEGAQLEWFDFTIEGCWHDIGKVKRLASKTRKVTLLLQL